MKKLVFATNNAGKLREVQALLGESWEVVGLKEIGCFEDIPETKLTIEGNAVQKAEFVRAKYGYECFADDTGLEIDALDGDPGVYSARYAGPEKDAEANMNKVLNNLGEHTDRNAQFRTVIALAINNDVYTFNGICRGEIINEKRGDQGFGYDPIFIPNGYNKTFAEMDIALKNKISHRSLAVQQLVEFLKNL